jgi:alpha-tubulin suppressor-like RCC1 family protein
VTWLSCGFEHCLALTSDGLVASWGCGASGCLGHNDYLSYTEPKMIEPEVLRDVSYVECGGYHSAAVNKSGKLFMWGRSDVGQLGLPKDKVTMDEHGYVMKQPIEVAYFSDIKVKSVALGEAHSVVLDREGLVQNSRTFQVYQVLGTPNLKVVKVASGAVFSLALASDGKVYSWGSGQNGQLGLGNTSSTSAFVPTLVKNL